MELSDVMKHVLKTCDIKYNGMIISRELIIKAFGDYLSQTIDKNNHNAGLVMHTGSVCFDVLMVTFAAITNLISNQMNTEDVLESLNVGDIVLYGVSKKERYIYEGIVDGKSINKSLKGKQYVKLSQNGPITYVSEDEWRLIIPYYGDSDRLDGRGIKRRKSLKDDFYTDVLSYEKSDIPGVIDTSSVIVADKEDAENLVKGISIAFKKKEVKLLDLVTASYFTEEDEYRYGGNTGKNEAILKFTSKISVARGLVLSRRGNTHLGIVVLGNDIIRRGMSELPELINRQSLKYLYLCASMDFEYGRTLLDENEELELFVCSKDFLNKYSIREAKAENTYTSELVKQMWVAVNRKNIVEIVATDMIDGVEYEQFRKNLLSIKRSDYNSPEKEEFVIQSFSLMNFFLSTPFSNESLYRAKHMSLIETALPQEKLDKLEECVASFPSSIKGMAEEIVGILSTMNTYYKIYNHKYDWLYEYLSANADAKKVAVILPKAYYGVVLKEERIISKSNNVFFYTAGKFDSKTLFDRIIVFGDYEGKRFNSFRCNSASQIITVLYDFEKKSYAYKKKATEREIWNYQKRSTILIESDYTDVDEVEDAREVVETQKEIEEYISNLDFTNYSTISRNNQGDSDTTTDIVAIALFGDDSKAFFSKHYKGYVLDETTGNVREEDPMNFTEGDSIVFTRSNSDTKDIVSSVLSQLISDNKLSEHNLESYRKAMLWKESLIDYMHNKGFNAQQVSDELAKTGETVHVATVRNWLDEDSHVVGPRDVESIRRIGRLTGIKELMDNPEGVFEACREIRSIRRRILEQIGKAIVDKLSGKPPVEGTLYNDIYEKIDTLAVTMQIERITFTETKIPMNMANRPTY